MTRLSAFAARSRQASFHRRSVERLAAYAAAAAGVTLRDADLRA